MFGQNKNIGRSGKTSNKSNKCVVYITGGCLLLEHGGDLFTIVRKMTLKTRVHNNTHAGEQQTVQGSVIPNTKIAVDCHLNVPPTAHLLLLCFFMSQNTNLVHVKKNLTTTAKCHFNFPIVNYILNSFICLCRIFLADYIDSRIASYHCCKCL